MQTNVKKLFAFSAFLLCAGIVSFKLFVAPILLHKAQIKLNDWFKQSEVAVQFKEVKLLWNGVRIVRLEMNRGEDRFRSDVAITFGFTSSQPFLKPTLVTFEKAKILVYRHGAKLPKAESSNLSAIAGSETSLVDFLDRYFTAGISVQLKRANVQVFDNNKGLLFAIPSLDLKLNAGDRTAQIDTKAFRFKQSNLLSQMSGQILMQKQREYYPFLLQARDPNGEPWQLKGQISHDFETIDLRHKRRGVPVNWSSKLAVIGNPDDVQVLVRLKLEGLMSGDKISYDMKVASNNLYLQHSSLGKTPLGPWPFSLQSRGVFVPETASLAVDQGELYLISKTRGEPVHLSFSGSKKNLQTAFATDPFEINFNLTDGSCQSLLAALPRNLLPTLAGLELDGRFSIDGTLKLLSADDLIRLTPKLNRFDCRITASPEYLTRNWLFQGKGEIPDFLQNNPSMRAIKSGHAIGRASIPDDFFKGLVAAEDAKFWRHDGIIISSLVAAMQANIKAGHVVFGGSTITMQLAKNLYLDRDRVISRKIQEIALAWVLEQNLSKAEILELYANAVEFAPQTYGIARASALYFNKAVTNLTSAESLFLASILPSPTRNYTDSYCQARLSPELRQRMGKVALGLNSLSQEKNFIGIYETDVHNFQFPETLQGCETLATKTQNKRFGKGKVRARDEESRF